MAQLCSRGWSPPVRGARLEPSKPQSWAQVGMECPHCPLTLQSPITSLGPYSPKSTPIPSFLCKQLNKLFSDRQVRVWVQWCWEKMGS